MNANDKGGVIVVATTPGPPVPVGRVGAVRDLPGNDASNSFQQAHQLYQFGRRSRWSQHPLLQRIASVWAPRSLLRTPRA